MSLQSVERKIEAGEGGGPNPGWSYQQWITGVHFEEITDTDLC